LLFSSRRRHTRFSRDWSSDVCSSDLSSSSTSSSSPPSIPSTIPMGIRVKCIQLNQYLKGIQTLDYILLQCKQIHLNEGERAFVKIGRASGREREKVKDAEGTV